jgi:hypothetical protein
MARKFFYICAGMFLLALSYHFGASTAVAQAPSNPVVATWGSALIVFTANGDVYMSASGTSSGPWVHESNVFTGGPTPALHESWGQVKARYQNTPGVTVTPGANDK